MSLVPAPSRAGAVLFIYPTIVMFEGNQRSAEITLTNRGDQTGTFEMSWSDLSMTPAGGLAKYEGQAPWSVQPYVRYSPRRVKLAPSESGKLRAAAPERLAIFVDLALRTEQLRDESIFA